MAKCNSCCRVKEPRPTSKLTGWEMPDHHFPSLGIKIGLLICFICRLWSCRFSFTGNDFFKKRKGTTTSRTVCSRPLLLYQTDWSARAVWIGRSNLAFYPIAQRERERKPTSVATTSIDLFRLGRSMMIHDRLWSEPLEIMLQAAPKTRPYSFLDNFGFKHCLRPIEPSICQGKRGQKGGGRGRRRKQ